MIKMLNKLFSKSEEELDLVLPVKADGQMVLKLENLVIGYLSCKNGEWTFKYSEEFKNQNDYHKIIGFPELDEEYKSNDLWPFFRIRIPGLKQPAIREIIEIENIQTNEYELLKRFGKKTISNPYELVS